MAGLAGGPPGRAAWARLARGSSARLGAQARQHSQMLSPARGVQHALQQACHWWARLTCTHRAAPRHPLPPNRWPSRPPTTRPWSATSPAGCWRLAPSRPEAPPASAACKLTRLPAAQQQPGARLRACSWALPAARRVPHHHQAPGTACLPACRRVRHPAPAGLASEDAWALSSACGRHTSASQRTRPLYECLPIFPSFQPTQTF